MFPTFASSQQGFWLAIPDKTYGMKFYRYLYNAHTTSRAAGLATYYDYAGTTYPGITVKQAATANLPHMAGVHNEAVATVAWGWVLTEGYHATVLMTSTGADSDTAGVVGQIQEGSNAVDQTIYDAAAGTVPTWHTYIVRLATSAAGVTTVTASVPGWVKCM